MEEPKKEKIRTLKQNAALHKFYEHLSETLNVAGLEMSVVLSKRPNVPWTPSTVKELLWRPIQTAQLGKRSTTELTTREIDLVFDTLNRFLATEFHLHEPFPSIETLMENEGWYDNEINQK